MAGSAGQTLDTDAMSGPPAQPAKPPDDAMSRPHFDADRPAAPEARPRSRTHTPAPDPFQEAVDAAKAAHAAPADDEPAGDEGIDTDAAPRPARGAGGRFASTTVADEDAPAGPATATAAPAEPVLVSDTEFTALQAQYANQPERLVKELNRAFTKKTQAIAAERKTFERLRPYEALVDAYEEDPATTLQTLADEHGYDLVPRGSAKPTGPAADPTPTKSDVDEFRDVLGPELEYLAEPLAPAVTTLIDRKVAAALTAALGPVRQQQEALVSHAATEQSAAVMTAFGKQHPDWQAHEPAMLALAQQITPKGMTELAFLEHLYSVATRAAWDADKDAKIADGVQKALKRMQRGGDATERPTHATPASDVVKGPPTDRPATFEEAAAAARRGERWE